MFRNANGEWRKVCECGARFPAQYAKCFNCANKSFTEAVRTKRETPQKPATLSEEGNASSVEDYDTNMRLYAKFI